jgi:hypothetical protein
VSWDWGELQALSGALDQVVLLSQQDIQLFAAIAAAGFWPTRWESQPATFDPIDEYVSGALGRIMSPVDLCSLIIDCIENEPGVYDAIRDQMRERGVPPPGSGSSPSDGDTDSVLVTGCNFDDIYGQCVALEDYIAQVARDAVEVAVNSPGAIAATVRIVSFLPFLGDLPVANDLGNFVTWLQVQGLTTFDAGYTTALRQNNICALFESACGDCELSMQDIVSIYTQGGAIAYNLNDPLRLLAEVVVGNVAPALFVYGVMSVVTAALATGGEVAGLIGLSGLQTIAATGNPDGDWALLCNPCAFTWSYTVDFGNLPPEIQVTDGAYDAANDRLEALPAGFQSRATLAITVPATTFTRIELGGFSTASNVARGAFIRDTGPSPTVLLDRDDTTVTGSRAIDWQGSRSMTTFFCRIDSDNGGTGYMDKLVFYGTGVNPF